MILDSINSPRVGTRCSRLLPLLCSRPLARLGFTLGLGPVLVLVLVAGASTVTAQAPGEGPSKTDQGPLRSAFTSGKTWVKFRPRYEYIDQDGLPNRAYSGTIRTHVGYSTADFHGFSGTIEFEAVSLLGDDGYNDTINGKTSRPFVADPESAEVNQSFLQYERDNLTVRAGRQRIIFGNHRFVGNVGWRQNEQTFDAVSLELEDAAGFDAYYAFVGNVNRIFSDRSPIGDHRMASHLVNVERDLGEQIHATAYLLYLDYDTVNTFSTSTVGARLDGKHPLSDEFSLIWVAEYASQQDISGNPNQIDASYTHAEAVAKYGRWSAGVGLEFLGGSTNPNDKFSTPLSTLHKFNGWADNFLTTPAGGLDDRYAKVSGDFGKTKFTLIYHDFSAYTGDADYGSEIDGILTHKTEFATYGFKFAAYNGSAPVGNRNGANTEVVWAWVAFGF